MKRTLLVALGATMLLGIPLLALGSTNAGADDAKTLNGWGTVRGTLVFEGAKIPDPETLKVDKDQEHCLSKGAIKVGKWSVNPTSKALANVVVFLRPEPGKKLAVHDSLKVPTNRSVLLDQPLCQFTPHVIAMRADQQLQAKNPAPVAHNIVIQGFKNSQNVQLSPGTDRSFEVFPENNVIGLSCGAHPWMKGSLWCFEHPYFAITDKDGNFEIKLAPAGNQTLVLWHEEVGYIGGKKGRQVNITPNGVADTGKIGVKPE